MMYHFRCPGGRKERQDIPASIDKSKQHINAQEAEIGADGTRYSGNRSSAYIREQHEKYNPIVLALLWRMSIS
jgi:hypothetical protein